MTISSFQQGDSQFTETRKANCASMKPLREEMCLLPSLRHHLGNQAIQHLFRSGHIHAKLAIRTPDDPLEREADNIAHTIMRKAAGAPCSCSPGEEMCEECQQKQSLPAINRHASAPSAPDHVPRIVGDVLRSSGHPLDSATRAFFEPRFARDLSDVRVHTSADAADSARSINAHAYTLGSDIVFNSGQYSPDTTSGRTLLAHELAHVVHQQSTGTALQRKGEEETAPAPSEGQGRFQSPQDKLAVERAQRLLPILKAYLAEWTAREIRRLHTAAERDPLLEKRRKMDVNSADIGPPGMRAKIEEQKLAALNRLPLDIEITEEAIRFHVKFQVRFEDPSASSRFSDLKASLVEGIKMVWNQKLQGMALGGRQFTIEPTFSLVSTNAPRDRNSWLITVRASDSSPVAYPGCSLDQPPAGVPTAVTDSTCDGGVMSLPPVAINKPDVLGHELLHLFGLVDRYLALTSVKPGQKPVTEESPTRETGGRPDPLGAQEGTILAEDLAFLFSRLGVYAIEENRGLNTLRDLERKGMTIVEVGKEIDHQEEIIRLGHDPRSLIPERKDFRDKILQEAGSL